MEDVDLLIREYELTVADLKHEQARAHALFLSIGDGAIATDKNGKVFRINKAGRELLGLTEAESIGKWFPRLVAARDQEGQPVLPLERPITQAFLSGKPIQRKLQYRISDGSWLPVAITVSPIMFGNKPVGAIEVFRDIGHEQEVDRMKNEFISLASHQLRTPLTAINTYSRMLSDGFAGDLTGAQQNYMDTILNSVERMNQIISSLLDIAKLESGKIHVIPETIDFAALLHAILVEQQNAADKKHITVKVNVPDKPIKVRADKLLLKEICANLFSNAIKYTPENGKVTISLHQKNDVVLLTVKDTGYGIPEEEQHRTFSKFFRAPNIVTKETTGSGLGLYMVKSVVDVMGGEIRFKSKEDVGSTFYVSLPAAKRKETKEKQRTEPPEIRYTKTKGVKAHG